MAVSASAADSSSEPSGQILKTDGLKMLSNASTGKGGSCFSIDETKQILSYNEHKSHETCVPGGYFVRNSACNSGGNSGYNYLTIDFDFNATGYYDANGDVGAESGMLSYTEGMRLSMFNGSTYINGNTIAGIGYFVLGTEESNKNYWYFSEDNVYDSSDIPLSTVSGVNNHITVIDNCSKVFIFVNGEYLTKATYTFKNKSDFRFGFTLSGAKTSELRNFSVKLENMQTSAYVGNYSTGDAKFGIDDYLKIGDYNMNLYTCEDVIRDEAYVNANLATFTYKNLISNNIRTGLYNVNKALTYTEHIDLDNDWYDVKTNSWKLEGESKEIAAGGTYTLISDDFEIVSDLTVKFNLSLSTRYYPYFYVPVPDENIGVSNIIVKDAAIANPQAISSSGTVEIDCKEYNSYKMATYASYGAASKVNGSFTFTVNYRGKTQTLTKSTGNIALYSYLSKVATDYGCGSEEAVLALSLMRFCNEGLKLTEHGYPDGYPQVNTYLEKHVSCKCAIVAAADLAKPAVESGLDASALSSKGYLISYSTNASVPHIVIKAPKAEAEKGISAITATLTGVKSDNTYGEVIVKFNKDATASDADANYDIYISTETTLDIFNLAEVMEFKVEYDGGEAITGTHSIAKYINDLGDDNACLNVSKAIYAFAEAAKEFKLEEKAAQ
jgi:hypothetical protein